MRRLIVADAGPLIALGKLEQIALLGRLFDRVLAPDAVLTECLDDPRLPGAAAIRVALKEKLIQRTADPAGLDEASLGLDAGERAAILAAQELGASILVDEKRGREVAARLGLDVIGTVGVIVLAKQRRLIKRAKLLLSSLKVNGYYVSEGLLKAALRLCGE